MHNSPSITPNRHVPFKPGGWGIALFIVFLAAVCAGSAYYVHVKTYRPPTDVRSRAVGDASQSQR
ncbi:MAG TPA: hypothetical protein VGG78_10400 [Gemmatimonadaceae bacterium]|jgi:hypothetical protein